MTLRTSWAVQDAIDQEDARVHIAAGWMPGLRATAPYGDMPIARAGFRPGYGGNTPGKVTMVSPTQCTIAPFQIVLPSRRGSVTGGAYIVTNDSTITLDLTVDAHASLSRIDQLVVVQKDTYYNDSGSGAEIVQFQGPFSDTPSLPTIDGDYFELARWILPKNTTDLRTVTVARLGPPPSGLTEQGADRYTVAAGGVLPVPNDTARDLLTAKGWAGLTVYNQKSGNAAPPGLEVLSGPGGTWQRTGSGSSLLKMVGDMTPAAQPVKVDCTLYVFKNDLWLWRSPGVWTRLTYNNVDAEWKACDLPSSSLWPEMWPAARLINPFTVQVSGLMYANGWKDQDLPNNTLLCRLPVGMRPVETQTIAVACEFSNDYNTTAKITVQGTSAGTALDGQIRFFCPDQVKAKWVSLDGVVVRTDEAIEA